MSHDGINGWAMGFGGMGILFWVVLVLVVAALPSICSAGAATAKDRVA
jgi:hypothetical protein